jgi:hypothetical protein
MHTRSPSYADAHTDRLRRAEAHPNRLDKLSEKHAVK